MPKEAEIKIVVRLDEKNVPEEISWEATEAEFDGRKPCDSLMLSMWDKQEKNTLGIELWTKDMQVGEMNAHFYFTLMNLAGTYERATNNKEIAGMLKNFANEFGKKVEQLAKEQV